MQTTLEFELIQQRLLSELADIADLRVVPYAGQDRSGTGANGEPVVQMPLITVRINPVGDIMQLGRGVEMMTLVFEIGCLTRNLQRQEDRLLSPANGVDGEPTGDKRDIQADLLARRVHTALGLWCGRKGDVEPDAEDAARVVLGTLKRTNVEPMASFGPMYMVKQRYSCTTKDADALRPYLRGRAESVAITPVFTTLTPL